MLDPVSKQILCNTLAFFSGSVWFFIYQVKIEERFQLETFSKNRNIRFQPFQINFDLNPWIECIVYVCYTISDIRSVAQSQLFFSIPGIGSFYKLKKN